LKTNLTKWIDIDLNPLIIFSQNGKILYLNDEAEYFLAFVSEKEIFDLAISLASTNKGYKIVPGEFRFGKFEFGAVSVGYENDEEIGIRFYKVVCFAQKNKKTKHLEKVNLFFVIDFCKNYALLNKNIDFVEDYDVDIPEFYVDKSVIIKTLNKVFENVVQNKIKIIVRFLVGEKYTINDKTYKVISIDILSKTKEFGVPKGLLELFFYKDKVQILIPFVENI